MLLSRPSGSNRSSLVSPALPLLGALVLWGVSGCCFGGTPAAPAPVPAPFVPVATAPVAAPGAAIAANNVTLSAGFVPDPTIVYTFAGGPVSASTMAVGDVWCAGYIATLPNVSLTTTTPIYGMRILARATDDTTLAVRLADGRVLCNDDGGGYPNPAITIDMLPPGVHQVYVGSFHMGDTPLATVGFTTNPGVTNVSLP